MVKLSRTWEHDSSGYQRHSMGHEVTPHEHQTEIFAKELAEFLEKHFISGHFQNLVLVSPPEFLGEVRKVLSEKIKHCITKELDKDFPDYLSDDEVEKQLAIDLG